jgi:hypothetical protein
MERTHQLNFIYCASRERLSIKRAARITVFFALAGVLPLLTAAQETTPPSNPDSPSQTPADKSSPTAQQSPAGQPPSEQDKKAQDDKGQGKTSGTSNDRLFYALPNFLSIDNTAHLPPLTVKQKFGVVARGTFDPVQYPWWALLSAVGQADNSEPGYGQGWGAYGKRFLTTAADSTIENFMTGAVLPSILHQDPRFYASTKGGFTRRTFYAVSRIFVTRADDGHPQFNYSEIVGSAMSAAISTYSYHPRSTYISTPTNPHMFIPSDRTLTNTASVWGTQVAYDTITIAVKEFWPDIHRKLAKKSKTGTVSPVQ